MQAFKFRFATLVTRLSPHRYWLMFWCVLTITQLVVNFAVSSEKVMDMDNWLDLTGEFGTVLFLAFWFLLILFVRPSNTTTAWLAAGFIGLMASGLQDALDEIIQLPDNLIWDSLVESLPIGVLCLTVGLIRLSQELQLVSRMMNKRQHTLAASQSIDKLTDLPYVWQLQNREHPANESNTVSSLILISLFNIQQLSHSLNRQELDAITLRIADWLLLNLGENELLYRAGLGQFAVLLPDIGADHVSTIQQELMSSLRHARLPDRTLQHTIQFSAVNVSSHDIQLLPALAEKCLQDVGSTTQSDWALDKA